MHRCHMARPQVLSLVALDVALDAWDGVQMDAVRSKSLALSELFIELVEVRFLTEIRDDFRRFVDEIWRF